MKSPIYYGFLLLVCGFVLPACIHVHPGQSAFAQEHGSGADEDRDRGHDDERVDRQVQRLVEQLDRLHQEIGRVEEQLEQLHQRRDRNEAGNREGRGRSERGRPQRNRENRGGDDQDREEHRRDNDRRDNDRRDEDRNRSFHPRDDQQDGDLRRVEAHIQEMNVRGQSCTDCDDGMQGDGRFNQRRMPGRGAAGRVSQEMGEGHAVEMIVDFDRSARGGRMMGIDVPGNSDHGVFIVEGAAQGGAGVMRELRGAIGRGQQRMGRGQQRMGRVSMMGQTGAGGMAIRGKAMGRGSMMSRPQMMGRSQMMGGGSMMSRPPMMGHAKMMGFDPSVEGHQGIAMSMNHGAGPICASCQGSAFIGGNRTAFGNVLKECQSDCSEGDACSSCAGKDDGEGQHRIIKRVMRFDGDLDDVNLHLEHGGDFQFGESGNAKVMMIGMDDFDGELPDEFQHLLQVVDGVKGSTADIEVHHFRGDEDGGQIGDRVFQWKTGRTEGNREARGGEHSSEMQFDIQVNSDGGMPIDIQRILKQVGGDHQGSGEIEIHTIIEKDGDHDEKVIEWNGDLDEIPAAIQEIIGDLEGGAIEFGGGEGHGAAILIQKIAEGDGQIKKVRAAKKKAAANKKNKNKNKNKNKKKNKNKNKKKKKKKKKKKPDTKKAAGVELESGATDKFVLGGTDGEESIVTFGSTGLLDPDEQSIHWSGSLEEMPDHIREKFESLDWVDVEELELPGDFDEIPDDAKILRQPRDLPKGQRKDSNKKKAVTDKK
ncbi:MAG: hypothetical protein OSB12_04885, partial [Planctomycetota bacterium]|nr:hypothetical protein [Planctomycetota bacterium]